MDLGKKGQLRQQYSSSSKAYRSTLRKKKADQIEIFCDLMKACDVINHEMLLAKLNVFGVRGIGNSWFKSYLAHWKQVGEINYNGSNYEN
jgi:hypothetical protein